MGHRPSVSAFRAGGFPVRAISIRNGRNRMFEIDLFQLLYTIGELLTTTWLGRLVLGMAIGSMLARIARM
jgi:hypothetical protein